MIASCAVLRGPVTFLLCGSLALSSCEARLSLGAGCARSSDCPDRLVCARDRCRVACVDHRDCPIGTRCVAGLDGMAECTLPDERCDDTHPCEAGTICVAGQCFDPCAGASCPAGGVCERGLCVGGREAPDGGTASGLLPHRSCEVDGDCASDEACTRILGGRPACRRRCSVSSECDTGETTSLCTDQVGADGTTALVCTLPCDLFDGAGCPTGETCDLVGLLEPTTVFVRAIECRPIDPARRAPGESCDDGGGAEDFTLCAPGVACIGSSVSPFVCETVCTVGGTLGPACPAGTVCAATDANPVRFDGATVGTCAAP